MTEEPQIRKPLGVLLVIVLLTVYVLVAARLADPILSLPVLAQVPLWIALGIIWIFPMKPLVRWIETGQWK